MSELNSLYQEVILDHNRHPRHCHPMTEANATAEGFNPLCGDKLTVFLKIEDKKIIAASFVGAGCAISTASASMMTEALTGKTLEQAHSLFHLFHETIINPNLSPPPALGKLRALTGVKAFPARVKCATLAWHTLENALTKNTALATTEN